ncbi:PP2C family protein-serine/threonine phosphatase [Salirhabdus salicampi]|uniref:PP2C family protein-serine/threonine phosphatase n=1 Tax=Salirhabdus salicampi TaxID=476102 RepID=UPI0020C1F71B|nr:PP2C family protein-serine/threonine phosphatase [Salirhabdus salicampi]MCP8615730.1 serine/threonine-protein phosphatase [Salirhabdus salicampi]
MINNQNGSLWDEATLQREIKNAQDIQQRLLNANAPTIDGATLIGTSIPARLIGGDYYDFYRLKNGKVRIIIGDVMGKGIPAAMLMILTRGAFRSACESTDSPSETLEAMNDALYSDLRTLHSFVTVFCADWDPTTNTLSYANAGHNLPLWIHNDFIRDLPRCSGIMLGGLPNQQYKEEELQLGKKDTVFFYTDGIVEAMDKEGNQFKRMRLIDTLDEVKNHDASQIKDTVLDEIESFTQGITQKDDITLIVFKVQKED